jgi:3',5'-cyclic AMP phosphodiesterase CpdA
MNRRTFLISSAALLGLPRVLSAQPPSFTIATINDLHLDRKEGGAMLARVVDSINARGDIVLTVVLGDLTTAAQPEEFDLAKAGLTRLKMPFCAVPGNHDVNKEGSVEEFERRFGPANWKRNQNGWVFLGLNSCEGLASDVTLSGGQLQWLREEVAGIAADTPVALFLHHPLNPHSKSYRVKNADEVLTVFAGKKLRLAAAGHFHGNQEERANGVLFTTTACASGSRGNHDKTTEKGYRLFHCTADSVETEFVTVA